MPPETIRQTAAQMLTELQSTGLVVLKGRSRDGWVRYPVSQNPEWYQQLCRQHERPRKRYPKSRTIIKRCQVERALRRIIAGLVPRGNYGERLMPIIEQEAERRQDVPHTHTHTDSAIF